MANLSSFSSYKQAVMEITGDLKKLKEFSERLKLEGNTALIDDVIQRLVNDTFSVAIIGEFKRGKSTLINALLGKDVLPTDILPTTAALNKITYSVTPFAKIEYKDGKTEDIEIDRLNDYVTKLTKESEERAKSIKEATVYYPVNYCRNGVTIIDTPGLNDDAAMTEVTLSVLPQIDAALMVIMAQAPFSESERDFLESRIITSDLGRVLFVVTGIDRIDEDEDVDRVLSSIANSIQEKVIAKARNTFGEDSKEFEAYKSKIGKVRVFGLSAKKALKAKIKGDNEMLEKSCFPEFENELERFLTEDRGAVTLSAPISRIKTSSIELAKAVALRECALKMEKEQFNERYSQAMEEIETIRKERQNEFERINKTTEQTYRKLLPAIDGFWPAMEKAAETAIDSCTITEDDLSKEKAETTQKRVMNVVRNALTKESQSQGERIQEAISKALENEADRMAGFEKLFFESTNKIQDLFVNTNVQGSLGGNDDDVGAATVLNAVGLGLGGVYMGYRQAGWKGALLGGATSLATTAATAFGVGALIGVLAIPVTWPVVIIGTLVAGLVGAFTGKSVLNAIFGGGTRQIDKFKSQFKNAIKAELKKMQANDDYGEKVKKQVETAFEALKEKIKTETESILTDTQNQLTDLKVKSARAEAQGDTEKAELKKMLETIDEICARAEETNKQLVKILSR